MPRLIILAAFTLAACSDAPQQAERPVARPGASLVGLYERMGAGAVPDRMCVTEEGGNARFGLVIQGNGAANCTATGRVAREGARLTLAIDSAPACAMGATTTAAGVTLSAAEGAECAYYCGSGAELTPGDFIKVGATEVDARRTVDVAGEPLC